MSSTTREEAVFNLNWRRVRLAMVWIVVAIIVIHAYVILTDDLDLIGEEFIRRLADLDSEAAVPTWISTMLMAAAAVLCWTESRLADPGQTRRWAWLGFGFFILSIDEVAGLHGSMRGPVRRLLDIDNPLFYGWVLPAIMVMAVAAVYFYPLIPTLPTKVRRRILIAGTAFVVGAIGLEMVGGVLAQSGMRGGWTYFMVSTIEELVEIISVFYFVDTMAMWFAERGTAARFMIGGPPAES